MGPCKGVGWGGEKSDSKLGSCPKIFFMWKIYCFRKLLLLYGCSVPGFPHHVCAQKYMQKCAYSNFNI